MENKDKVSIIFGDSIAYGKCDKEMCGWVHRIRNHLDNISNNNFVINLGIPGQTIKDIEKRMEQELRARYNLTDEFIIIYSIGIKDSVTLNNIPEHEKDVRRSIENIIKTTKKYTNKIYFLGLFFPDFEKRKEFIDKSVIKIDNIIKQVCNKEEAEYVALSDEINKELLEDGLHPNSEGHKKIAKKILEKIYNFKEA